MKLNELERKGVLVVDDSQIRVDVDDRYCRITFRDKTKEFELKFKKKTFDYFYEKILREIKIYRTRKHSNAKYKRKKKKVKK